MNRPRPLVLILLLALLPCLCYWEVFRGDLLLPTDWVYRDMEPWRRLGQPQKVVNERIKDAMLASYALDIVSARAARQGDVLLWNRFAGGGMPHLAGGFSRMLYPPFWIYGILPSAAARNVEILLHLFLASLFAFLFLRRVGANLPGAFVGGAIFALTPSIVHRAEMSFQLPSIIWFPLLLYFIEGVATNGRTRDLAGLAFAVALQLYAGYYPDIFINFLGAGAYGLCRIFVRVSFVTGVRRAFQCLAGVALGAALASPFLLPSLNLILEANRPTAPVGSLASTGLGVEALLTAFSPWIHRSQLYVGLMGLAFVPLAYRKESRPVALSLTSAIGVSLAISAGTPLLTLLQALAPFVNNLRYVHTLISVASFGMALLAGLGVSQFFVRESSIPRRIAVAGTLLAVAALPVLDPTIRRMLQLPLAACSLGVLAGGLVLFQRRRLPPWGLVAILLVCIGLELGSYARAVNPRISPETLPPFPDFGSIDFLKRDKDIFRAATLLRNYNSPFWPNTLGAYGIEDIGAYHSLIPGPLGSYMGRLQRYGGGASRAELLEDSDSSGNWMTLERYRHSNLLRIWNIKYFLLPAGWANPDPATLELVYDAEVRILRLKDWMPRVWLAEDVLVLPDERGAYAKLLDPGFAPERTVVLEEEPLCHLSEPGDMPSDSHGEASVAEYRADRIVIETEATHATVLFVSQSFDPGWTAEVDGHRNRVLRANVNFQAIPLAAGRHRVELRYRPASYRWGWSAALVAGSLTLVFVGFGRLGDKKPVLMAVVALLPFALGVGGWEERRVSRRRDTCGQLSVASRILPADHAPRVERSNGSMAAMTIDTPGRVVWSTPKTHPALLLYRIASASPDAHQTQRWALKDASGRTLDFERIDAGTQRWLHQEVPIPRDVERIALEVSSSAGEGALRIGSPMFLTAREREPSRVVFLLDPGASVPTLSDYGPGRLRVLLSLGGRPSLEAAGFDEIYASATREQFSRRLAALTANLYRVRTLLVVAPARDVDELDYAQRQLEIFSRELERLGLDGETVELRILPRPR